MIDFVIIFIIVLCFLVACYQIYKKKKKGKSCCGCSFSGSCTGSCGSNNNANESEKN